MLMQYEDLQAKQADIRKFKITREIQKVRLSSRALGGIFNCICFSQNSIWNAATMMQ